MKIILAICLVCGCYSAKENLGFSVVGSPRWAISLGGRADDRGMDVIVDSQGDVIVAGDFNGPADLGDGLDNIGGPWGFISKRVASDGSLRWTRRLVGQSSPSNAYVADLALGSQDSVVATGSYMGTVDFGGMTLTAPPDASRMFIASYAPNGTLQWLTQLNDFAQPTGLAIDPAGRIFITGTFWRSTLNFNGQLFHESDNDADSFLAALDAQGSLLWGTALRGAAPGTIDGAGPWSTGVAITPNGDVLVAGSLTAPVSVGGAILVPESRIRTFVTRFTRDGVYLASHKVGPVAPAWSEGPEIAVDVAGHIVIQQVERPGGDHQAMPWETMDPATLHVLDDAGQELWTSQLLNHGRTSPQMRTLTATSAGLIVTSAWADNPMTVTGGMEVAAFDAQGTPGIDTFGSTLATGPQVNMTFDAAADAAGALAFTGAFAGSVDFGTGAFHARGQGDTDIFVVVVDPPAN